ATAGLCPECLFRGMLDATNGADDALDLTGDHADPMAAAAPDTFGNYRPLRVLGQGGMGVVFLAEQTAPLRREVALKVLKSDLDRRDIGGRFRRERASLAKLAHPNIVTIFDAGLSTMFRPYFVMEAVNGAPFTDYCEERKLGLDQRVRLFLQVCNALDYAH